MSDRHRLSWSLSTAPPDALPTGIERIYIQSPSGHLELLFAPPLKPSEKSLPPLFFLHGGFGTAAFYIPFMQYFAAQGYSCYSLSLRGHGNSWKPSYFRLVFLTTLHTYATDLALAIRWVREKEGGKDVVLMGHSSGGGLSQYLIHKGMERAKALVLLAAIPCFGSWGVYQNWWALDPWFTVRMYFRDFVHPRSPLSSTTLVHRVFFSPDFPTERVKNVERLMPEFESFWWPIGMMLGSFVNTANIVTNLASHKILVVAGSVDALMGIELMRKMADQYRTTKRKLIAEKKLEAEADEEEDTGIAFSVVEGAGHHLMEDLPWEKAAGDVLAFLKRLT